MIGFIGGEGSPPTPQEAHLGDKTAKPVFSSRFVTSRSGSLHAGL
jgi:hypothetical protein